jgi:hypothetical protein
MSRTQCGEWFKGFKEGRNSVGEDPRSGRTSIATNGDHVERVLAVIRGSRRLTVRALADEVGISIGSCHQIFTGELQMLIASTAGAKRACTGLCRYCFILFYFNVVMNHAHSPRRWKQYIPTYCRLYGVEKKTIGYE